MSAHRSTGYADRQCKRRWPTLAPRTMPIYGVAADGSVMPWQAEAQVQPLDRLPIDPVTRQPLPGLYVIEQRGFAVAAYIRNHVYGSVVVDLMGSDRRLPATGRVDVEAMLLGTVILAPHEAAFLDAIGRRRAGP